MTAEVHSVVRMPGSQPSANLEGKMKMLENKLESRIDMLENKFDAMESRFEAKLEAGLRSQLITTITVMSSLFVVLAGLAFAAARLI